MQRTAFLLVMLTMVGCNSDRLPAYPTKILVRFDDEQPVEGGTLVLRSATHACSASGRIDERGECRPGTYVPGDGAVEGTHQVSIVPARPPGDPDTVMAKQLIDLKYSDPRTSGLTIDVKPTDKNEFRLQVPRLKP